MSHNGALERITGPFELTTINSIGALSLHVLIPICPWGAPVNGSWCFMAQCVTWSSRDLLGLHSYITIKSNSSWEDLKNRRWIVGRVGANTVSPALLSLIVNTFLVSVDFSKKIKIKKFHSLVMSMNFCLSISKGDYFTCSCGITLEYPFGMVKLYAKKKKKAAVCDNRIKIYPSETDWYFLGFRTFAVYFVLLSLFHSLCCLLLSFYSISVTVKSRTPG